MNTARECIKHGCQHPDTCNQCRCWLADEQAELYDEPIYGNDWNDDAHNDPRHGQAKELNRLSRRIR